MTTWVYHAGAVDGSLIKIGKTAIRNGRPLAKRIDELDGMDKRFVLLAAVRTNEPRLESVTQDSFAEFQAMDRRREYFQPADPILRHVLWLRAQHFTCTDVNDRPDDFMAVGLNDAKPHPLRRYEPPDPDPDRLFDPARLQGPLAGTAWDWMPDPNATFQDYFTPPELVGAAWAAMGNITLDAASHLLAQRRLHDAGIDIPDYYNVNRSGLENPWLGNVWLNPPYGDNAPWITKAIEELDNGNLHQLCWLSPAYVFAAKQFRPLLDRSSGMVLLTPTPTFYNPGDPLKTGTNHPHMIVYWGPARDAFHAAYPDHIRIRLAD